MKLTYNQLPPNMRATIKAFVPHYSIGALDEWANFPMFVSNVVFAANYTKMMTNELRDELMPFILAGSNK